MVRWKLDKHITYVAGEIEFMIVFASCEDIKDYQSAERIWQTKTVTCFIPETILATDSFTADSPLISKLLAIATQIDEVIGDADKVLVDMAAIKDEAIQSVQEAKDTINNFTGEDVRFTDGKTFQEKYDAGDLNGPPGPQGPEGAGLNILGTLASVDLLPVSGEPGQAYLIGGDLYVWTLKENRWTNVGQVKGDPGPAPTIGENNHWFINEEDTGIPVNVKGDQGDQGKSAYDIAVEVGYTGTVEQWLLTLVGDNGITPTIGENKHWFIGTTDTGIIAEGVSPVVDITTDGYWQINGVKSDKKAVPDNGKAATISIGTVTTANFSDPATVENVGTENAAILNFNIPKGEGVAEMQAALEAKQNSADDTLQTTAKTIVGAINELLTTYNSDLQTFLNVMNGAGGTA